MNGGSDAESFYLQSDNVPALGSSSRSTNAHDDFTHTNRGQNRGDFLWATLLHFHWGCTVFNLTCIFRRPSLHFTMWDKFWRGFPEDWCLNGILPQRRSIREHNRERNIQRDLIRRLCVIIPAPLYSRGSWLKDSQGYGLFFSLHLLIILSFFVFDVPLYALWTNPLSLPP